MIPPLLLAFGAALGALLLVFGVSLVTKPTAIQQRLDSIGGKPQTLTEQEMQQPFRDRILRPIYRSVAGFVVGRTPQATLDRLRRNLIIAGNPGNLDARDFLSMQAFAAVGGVLLALVFFARTMPTLQAVGLTAGLGFAGYFLPTFWLKTKISQRKKEIQLALPDALDLLTICVEAGLGFDAALNKLTEKWDNALTAEFGRALAEMRMGKARRDALRDLSDRTEVSDVSAFIAAVIQADQLGVSIGTVLITQAEQMRMKRRQRAEELANQAPIKMIFPMVLLILPALFIVILGPALPSILESFSGR